MSLQSERRFVFTGQCAVFAYWYFGNHPAALL